MMVYAILDEKKVYVSAYEDYKTSIKHFHYLIRLNEPRKNISLKLVYCDYEPFSNVKPKEYTLIAEYKRNDLKGVQV